MFEKISTLASHKEVSTTTKKYKHFIKKLYCSTSKLNYGSHTIRDRLYVTEMKVI